MQKKVAYKSSYIHTYAFNFLRIYIHIYLFNMPMTIRIVKMNINVCVLICVYV